MNRILLTFAFVFVFSYGVNTADASSPFSSAKGVGIIELVPLMEKMTEVELSATGTGRSSFRHSREARIEGGIFHALNYGL